VKRTRQFVRRHYPDDRIVINGEERTITFPRARAISVRYDDDGPIDAVFDRIEQYLDPSSPDHLRFSRYQPRAYFLGEGAEEDPHVASAIGLLRSGLLKRAESSVSTFAKTLQRMIGEHETFLDALDRGHVLPTAVLRELSGTDDDIETLFEHPGAEPETLYDVENLREDTEADLEHIRLNQVHIRQRRSSWRIRPV
jgi:hypothetical protein